MKKYMLLVTLAVGAAAFGQTGTGAVPSPADNAQVSPSVLPTNIVQKGTSATYTDVYCAGWMSPKDLPNSTYVLAGQDSPNTARFVKNDSVFLYGSGWQEGQKVQVVRRAKDPNYFMMYEGQAAEVGKMGFLFFDLGQATVTFVHGNTAVAHIDFSCDAVVPGDLVMPFQERQVAAFRPRPYAFKQYVANSNATKGRIVLSKDFDAYLGEGKKFYVNVGSNQGLKVGDYLRVYRGYSLHDMDPTDQASIYTASLDDDQYKEPPTSVKRYGELPDHTLGQAVVLLTTPTTATAMVVYSVEDIHIGDRIELMPPDTGDSGGSN